MLNFIKKKKNNNNNNKRHTKENVARKWKLLCSLCTREAHASTTPHHTQRHTTHIYSPSLGFGVASPKGNNVCLPFNRLASFYFWVEKYSLQHLCRTFILLVFFAGKYGKYRVLTNSNAAAPRIIGALRRRVS